MSNLSDKDIDRLSRDAAEFYEPDDSMLSWNKLEQQLIKHIPERPPDTHAFFRIRPLVWGPSILLLAGISYYIIKNATYRTHSTLKSHTESVAARPEDQRQAPGADNAKDNAPAVSPESAEENAQSAKTGRENKNLPDASREEASAKAIAGSSAEKLHSSGRSGVNGVARGKNENGSAQLPVSKAGQGNSKSGGQWLVSGEKGALNRDAGSGNIQSDFPSSPASAGARQNPKDRSSAVVQLPSPVIANAHPFVHGNDSSLNRFAAADKAQKQPVSKSLQINHSLVVGVVIGPDYTDVGGMSNDQLSNNIGISLGYYLTNRLSINTGFQYTAKYYWSDGKPFQPQQQPLNPTLTSYAPFPHIESVNGRCNMFEIPLTLRYDVYHREKIRIFVAAGFSSYLLRKQDYTYFFHNAGRAYEWQNENNDHQNYWFAIGNISAGIEQDLGKGFSFQAEPFVRAPFRGIGVGNMKMNSFGLLFSVRYSPVLGRTRR